MITTHDINVIEGEQEVSEVEYFTSLQRAINSGIAWSFQGSFGRTLSEAISAGKCLLGVSSARDYWGNYIPSRSEVKQGTKGSLDFVVQHSGQEFADLISNV